MIADNRSARPQGRARSNDEGRFKRYDLMLVLTNRHSDLANEQAGRHQSDFALLLVGQPPCVDG
ncbi:hypothetical protein V3C33_04840 [Micrococcaceae bacterium Sec5.7]